MGTLTETLRLVIEGDPKGAVGALRDVVREGDAADKASKRWGERMNTAANYALGAGTALAGAIAVSANKTVGYGQAVDDIADISNLSAEASSRLAGQLSYFDIALENAGTGVKFFEKNLDAARQGSEAQIDAFARLGISAEELKAMDDEDLLFRTRDAMADLDDKTARTAVTLQLFGKSGAELTDWLDAAPEDMEKLNAKLEDLGLVWDGEKVKNWQDLVDAQREMRISTMGLQMAIADPQFIGSLSSLVTNFAKLLQYVRPLMPAVPYLTAGLFTFGGVVKAIRMYQFVRDLGRSEKAASGLFGVLRNGRALGVARTGFSRLGGVLKGLPALLSSTGGMYGLVAAGIAVDTVLVYEAVKAWQEMRDAIRQANEAYADFQENLKNADWTAADDKRMKAKSSSWRTKEELAAAAEEDKYKSPWWAAPSNWVADRVGMAEGGTVPARRGGTFILAAEAGEDEDFVPASKRRAYAKRVLGSGAGRQAGGPVFDLRGSQFYGEPTPAIADRWANALGEAFMRRVTGNVAGVNVG